MDLHWYDNIEAMSAFLVLIALIAVVGFVTALGTREYRAAMGFGGLGAFIGLLAGLSETPVVGVVLPAVLTFMGGVTAYLFATQKESRAMTGSLLLSFSILLIVGVYLGANLRLSGVSTPLDNSITNGRAGPALFVEGGDGDILLQLRVDQDEVPLTIFDKITGKTISGTFEKGEAFTLIGQRFAITWPTDLDESIVKISAFEFIKGELVELSGADLVTGPFLEGNFYCMRVPSVEVGGCS